MRCLLAAAVVLSTVVVTIQDDTLWWKTAIFYQIYPRSFKDSDGDGVGDLKGITQMADYFKEIGVDAVWLSPIYKSPMADFGYDISDYMAIDPIFGTMDDFDALAAKLREIDVKLVLDFVPNHSSDEHPWFQKSLQNDSDYRDFYVWKDPSGWNGTTPIPPNNWISVFSGPAWQWRQERRQFYLHTFVKKQPDLNYRNHNVVTNMSAVLNFWLDKGVDGFRMDAVPYIFENITFPDEPIVPDTAGNTYATQQHIYQMNQPETLELLKSWADLVYQWVVKDGRPRAVFLEVYDSIPTTMKYYGTGNERLEFPFNFNLLSKAHQGVRASAVKAIIDNWMANMPPGGVANWVVGNHDNGRVADRYGPAMVDSINLLTGVLPGIKVTYNGAEIGMQDTFIRWDQTVDPSGLLLGPDHYIEGSRDPERTPMQWNASPSSGFSTNLTTWLPVNPNYWWLNVEAQKAAETSHLKVFQALAQARKDPVLQKGDYNVITPDNDTLIVVRSYNGSHFALIVNMASNMMTFTSQSLFAPHGLDMDMYVVTGSLSASDDGYKPGLQLKKGALNIQLRPKSSVLLRSGSAPPVSSSSLRLLGSITLMICALLAALKR